jgi:hypothetical protein
MAEGSARDQKAEIPLGDRWLSREEGLLLVLHYLRLLLNLLLIHTRTHET